MTESLHIKSFASEYIKKSYIRIRNFIDDALDSSDKESAENISKMKIEKYNITVYSNQRPSDDAIHKTNLEVNKIMNNIFI
ncbi:hypothetical protein [Bacillus sp. NMCN1]|uniref:hypothetical protein n=1 Tax=Bacillus sp. NMCN1 TaxID=2108536 RepID=UPI000D02B979|nr:hypothetical protein [Bacillus sp. NMCN1]PRR92881.1 hypothetical protein C6W21_05680 [Bacillus sp. NMCN1]